MIEMTEEWVSFWYQCLSQNIDYSLYCDARVSGDLCPRRLNIDPPCRFKFDPGRAVAF